MNNEKTNARKSEVYIRSDGWVFSRDGMDRLRAGGYKGFARYKESMEAKLGEWHRVSKPLDKDAAEVLKGIGGYFVERAVFLSSAIVKEAEVRARGRKSDTRTVEGSDSPAVFMRLTLTDDAYAVVMKMPNAEFREFVSSAILQAKRR
ncbi:MAG: hypothetical protein ACI4CE_07425 [Methanomethylophilus alvi]